MARILLTFSLLAFNASPTIAATLTTLQGKMLNGTITLGGGAILLKQADGRSFRIDPADVLHAEINPPHSLDRGLQLTSGETIALDAIQKLDDTGVHVTLIGGRAIVIPTDRVARLVFRHIPSAMEAHRSAGEVGVILDTGDFFQGELRELNGDHVRVDSVLFGVQNFDMNNQALAIVLHDAAMADASQMVRDTHGSIFLAEHVKATDGKLSFDDAQLGPMDLPQDQVAQLDAGGKLVQSLADLKPSRSSADDFKIDRTIAGVPMRLHGSTLLTAESGQRVDRGIAQAPGTTLSWRLTGSAQSFVATVGVPAALLPVGTVQFVVVADGHQIFRSRALSSIDDAQPIAIDLAGVTVLTLGVSSSSKVSGLEGLWLNPQCAHQ